MDKKLIIIGAGGHGKVVAEIAVKLGYFICGFLDDDLGKQDSFSYALIGKVDDMIMYTECSFFVAIGNNQIRKKIMKKLLDRQLEVVTLVDPSAVISKSAQIGKGCVVMPLAVVNANSIIEIGCIINTSSSVDHDCLIQKYTHICPGVNIAGTVTIGMNTWIGIGSSIINNLTIGKNVIIGAGSVVVKNIKDNVLAYGVPVIVKNKEGD